MTLSMIKKQHSHAGAHIQSRCDIILPSLLFLILFLSPSRPLTRLGHRWFFFSPSPIFSSYWRSARMHFTTLCNRLPKGAAARLTAGIKVTALIRGQVTLQEILLSAPGPSPFPLFSSRHWLQHPRRVEDADVHASFQTHTSVQDVIPCRKTA